MRDAKPSTAAPILTSVPRKYVHRFLLFISIRRHPVACLLYCHGTGSSFTSWLLLNWRSWSRHSTKSGPIRDGVTGIFHWHNPSGRTVALGSIQALTEMSTGNNSWGIKVAGVQGWQSYNLPVPTVQKPCEPQPPGNPTPSPRLQWIALPLAVRKSEVYKTPSLNRFLRQLNPALHAFTPCSFKIHV
jgi:hypothetical protein